jgi:hypothetical protein
MRVVAGGTAALPVDRLTRAEWLFVVLLLVGVVAAVTVTVIDGRDAETFNELDAR